MAEFRILFTARNYDETVAFYTETLGLPVLRSWDDSGDNGKGTIISAAGQGQIEIFAGDERSESPSGVALAWEIDEVDIFHDRLVAAEVEVVEPPTDRPWGHRNVTFRAPENLLITVFTVIGDVS